MATKQEKRQAALEKRERFLAEEKERGLLAQASDRERREEEAREISAAANSVERRLLNAVAAHLISGRS